MTTTRPPTRFGIIRHAKTVWNREKRIQGRKDSPLLPEGQDLAGAWGICLAPLGWDRILTSDAGRALETTERVNETLQVPVHPEPRLCEQDWGTWTGKTVTQLRRKDPRLLAKEESKGWDFCPPGGENRNKVWERSREALEEAAEKWSGTRILVITHEGVIKSLLNRLCGRKFLPSEPPLMAAWHMHTLICDRRGLRVEHINALKLMS